MAELKYEIVQHLAVIAEGSKGWCKELNLVSWNDRDPKFDLREWSPDHTKMGKGITLRDETDYPGTVDLTLLTEQQPVPTADGFAVGTLGGIRFDPDAATAAVTAVPITDPRLRTAWPETIYKITLHFQKMLKLELY